MAAVYVMDPNPTTRRCAQRALEALGAEVEAWGAWEEAVRPPSASLLVVAAGREPEAVWSRLAGWEGTPVIVTALHPEAIPAAPPGWGEAVAVLGRPFTPRELCAAAAARAPELRVEGELPFATPAPVVSAFDSMEVDIVVDEDIHLIEDAELLFEDAEAPGLEASEVGLVLPAAEDDLFEPVSAEDELPELEALLQTAELETLGSTEHFESDAPSWGSAEDLPGLGAEGGYEGEPTRLPEELAPHEATRMASMDALFPWSPPEELAPHEATRMAPLEALLPPPAAPTRPPGRLLKAWAIQLAEDWERIGMERDLDRRAELIQTAVMDIEPEPLAPPGLASLPPLGAGLAGAGEEASGVRLQGDLGLLRPADVLRMVREQRLSGALELHGPERAFRLTVQGDLLRTLEPRMSDPDLLLGRLLLDRGWVDGGLLEVALQGRDERPLGERLILAGALSEEALQEALRLQTRAYMGQIVAMQAGRFLFREAREGGLPPFGATLPRPLNLKLSALVVEVQRERSVATPPPMAALVPDEATRMAPAPSRPLTAPLERGKPIPSDDDAAELDAIVRRLEALIPLDPYNPGSGDL